MSSTRRKQEIDEQRRAARKLCAGLHAQVEEKVEDNRRIYTLVITKDGKPFTDFTIGATEDWMSGNFSISGRVIISWDRGRRKKRNKWDCWEYHSRHIADRINHYSKEHADIKSVLDSATAVKDDHANY